MILHEYQVRKSQVACDIRDFSWRRIHARRSGVLGVSELVAGWINCLVVNVAITVEIKVINFYT